MSELPHDAGPLRIPPLALKIIAVSYGLILVGLPLIIALRFLEPAWAAVAVFGAPLALGVVVLLFLQRAVLYIYYALFWWFQAAFALVYLGLAGLAAAVIVFGDPGELQAPPISRELVIAGIAGTAVLLIVLLMWRRGRAGRARRGNGYQAAPVVQPVDAPKAQTVKSLTYLEDWNSRKR
jgi:hypothetical protein